MLARGQKGLPRQDVGIPEGKLSALERLYNEAFPNIVLKYEVAEQFVMGNVN